MHFYRCNNGNSGGQGFILLLGGVDDAAHAQYAAGRLVVDDENKRSVDGQSRREGGKGVRSASRGDVIAALINGHDRFMIDLWTRNKQVRGKTGRLSQ